MADQDALAESFTEHRAHLRGVAFGFTIADAAADGGSARIVRIDLIAEPDALAALDVEIGT
jgi:hypothetical protein